ncbi:MAG TPA: hypothetical protein VD927_11495 [Chryseosolibacter sp.]|nr:hypothetical protein [Chryseosolibacter sp.]
MIIDKYLQTFKIPSRTGMGPELQQLIETQLTKDLRNYHVNENDLRFDWSQSYGTGRSAHYLDGFAENFNRIIVFDKDDNLLADGCMDFIANRFFFIAYWDLVTTWNEGTIVNEKKDQGMPFKIWRQLPEALMLKHRPNRL